MRDEADYGLPITDTFGREMFSFVWDYATFWATYATTIKDNIETSDFSAVTVGGRAVTSSILKRPEEFSVVPWTDTEYAQRF